jgi:hypothetical protein
MSESHIHLPAARTQISDTVIAMFTAATIVIAGLLLLAQFGLAFV